MNNFLQKALTFVKRCKIELIVLFGVIVLDLVSKQLVESTMELGEKIAVIPEIFNIRFILNKRAAYGMSFGLENLVGENGVIIVFIVITILAIIAFSFFFVKDCNRNWMFRLSLALIIGGAVGNLVDRITLQAVRDFLEIIVFDTAIFGCFNIADVALVVGVIAFIIYFLFMFDKDEKRIRGDVDEELIDEPATAEEEAVVESVESTENQEKDE